MKKLTLSIFGDSISTFEDMNPPGYSVFYRFDKLLEANIYSYNETWWGYVLSFFDAMLIENNSWSGSRVTRLPNAKNDFPSGISQQRISGLKNSNGTPDIIIIYLGTNDWGYGVKLRMDEEQSDWKLCFEESYNNMIYEIRKKYPTALVFCCTLSKACIKKYPDFVFPESISGIDMEEYNRIIRHSSKQNGCILLDIYRYNISYSSLDGCHPDALGMKVLGKLIIREMLKKKRWHVKYYLKYLFCRIK